VLQAISDAYTAFYARLRPSWRPPNPADLPSPFCPLALAIQRNIRHPVSLVQPQDIEFSDCWECTECSAVTKKCHNTDGVKDATRVPFMGHLKAQTRNEKVKHACPGCLKVFEDWSRLDTHVFSMEWEGWVCGPPPATLRPYPIGAVGVF
jgi:hypothetical protein